jgi:cytochrome c556
MCTTPHPIRPSSEAGDLFHLDPKKEHLMIGHARVLLAGAALLALGICILVAGSGNAADENEKAARAALRKVADLIDKGDLGAAKAAAKDIAKKYELEEVMHAFQLRTKKGEGLGEKPGAITPDGIEAKLINLAKKALPAKQLEKEADALARAAYISAAIAEVANFKVPEKDAKKNPKDWIAWTKDMTDAAQDLAKAAKAKDPKGVKEAANKLNTSCNNCHGVFRD